MNDQETVLELIKMFGDDILPVYPLPKAYCPGGPANVKAIYLGCDPTNKHSELLPFAFAHESGLKVFNSFLKAHTEQLKQIGLGWEEVYTQNLCRNYFTNETSKNPVWAKAANEFWIKILNEELSQFDLRIPVLLTSQILLEVLGLGGSEKFLAHDLYECRIGIPIPSYMNKLNRSLFLIYRGKSPKFDVSYHLKNEKWKEYKNVIIPYFK